MDSREDMLYCPYISRVDRNVYISGMGAACDPNVLERMEITKIIKLFPGDLYYTYFPHIDYLIIPAEDRSSFNLSQYIPSCMNFIKKAMDNDENVLVHCHAGISRSATIVLAHLMVNRGYSLTNAFKLLRSKRPCVNPNPGFFNQLINLNQYMKKLKEKKTEEDESEEDSDSEEKDEPGLLKKIINKILP